MEDNESSSLQLVITVQKPASVMVLWGEEHGLHRHEKRHEHPIIAECLEWLKSEIKQEREDEL